MEEKQKPSNVVDFSKFRESRQFQESLARGRTPLHASHIDGKIHGSPHFKRPDAEDFGDRMQRIRMSLEKINKLMADLKKVSRKPELVD